MVGSDPACLPALAAMVAGAVGFADGSLAATFRDAFREVQEGDTQEVNQQLCSGIVSALGPVGTRSSTRHSKTKRPTRSTRCARRGRKGTLHAGPPLPSAASDARVEPPTLDHPASTSLEDPMWPDFTRFTTMLTRYTSARPAPRFRALPQPSGLSQALCEVVTPPCHPVRAAHDQLMTSWGRGGGPGVQALVPAASARLFQSQVALLSLPGFPLIWCTLQWSASVQLMADQASRGAAGRQDGRQTGRCCVADHPPTRAASDGPAAADWSAIRGWLPCPATSLWVGGDGSSASSQPG
jgi:hypothetical protein